MKKISITVVSLATMAGFALGVAGNRSASTQMTKVFPSGWGTMPISKFQEKPGSTRRSRRALPPS